MIKLTEDEILEMVLTERFAEMKFAEFSADGVCQDSWHHFVSI